MTWFLPRSLEHGQCNRPPGDVDQFGAAVLRGALDDADAEHPDRVELHPTAAG